MTKFTFNRFFGEQTVRHGTLSHSHIWFTEKFRLQGPQVQAFGNLKHLNPLLEVYIYPILYVCSNSTASKLRKVMAKWDKQIVMAILTKGAYWPKPPENYLCKCTKKNCKVPEHNYDGDYDHDEYEDEEAGTSDSPALLTTSTLSGSLPKAPSSREPTVGATPAVCSAILENRRSSSKTLESGVSVDFIQDLIEIVADALQKEWDKETEILKVVAMLDQQIVKVIKDIRSEEQIATSGVAEHVPISTDIEPDVYETFSQLFMKVFVKALEKEREFRKMFPEAFILLRHQVVEVLRNLRKGFQNIPDRVARHEELMVSIRNHGPKVQRARGAKDAFVCVKRTREEEGDGEGEEKASVRRRVPSRHCAWCSFKVSANSGITKHDVFRMSCWPKSPLYGTNI
jgi:hypothetical protein